MVKVLYTKPFERELKRLSKRYRKIKNDIQPIILELTEGNFIGNQISGIRETVFKVRAKNSDIPIGKSGGYRIIYQIVSGEIVLLLIVYSKSDIADLSIEEIKQIIKQS